MTCVFCKIVAGTEPAAVVYRSSTHLAFLSRYPGAAGATVVIPREHLTSRVTDHEEDILAALMSAVLHVSRSLESFYEVDRCGVIFEGYGVGHLHAKVIPLHGTNRTEWSPIRSQYKSYMLSYQGYLNSADGPEVPLTELQVLAAQISDNDHSIK